MTYLELINRYKSIFEENHLSLNALYKIIYNYDNNLDNLLDLTNNLNKQINNKLMLKIMNIIEQYVFDDIPLERLLKAKEFYGLSYKLYNNVLIPRNETELLVDVTIEIIKSRLNAFNSVARKIKMLDLCCGCGAIGLSVKENIKEIDLTLSDISKEAIANTTLNAKNLNLDVKIILSDLFKNIHDKYTVITFNPPYIAYDDNLIDKSVLKYDPYNALYAPNKGLYYYEKILSQISNYLEDQYLVVMEIGHNQANDICLLINKYLKVVPKVLKDTNNKDRIIIINRL